MGFWGGADLGAGGGAREEDARRLTGEGAGLAWGAEGREALDDGLDGAFSAEARGGEGGEGEEEEGFHGGGGGLHFCGGNGTGRAVSTTRSEERKNKMSSLSNGEEVNVEESERADVREGGRRGGGDWGW